MKTCHHTCPHSEEMSLSHYFFLSPEVEGKDKESPKTITSIYRKDTYGVNSDSLYSRYKALWKVIHEYEMDEMVNSDAVQHAFIQFIYFPFNDVVDIFTDTSRKLTAKALGLTYYPYTRKQADAIYRLTHYYPRDNKLSLMINDIKSDLNTINNALDRAVCCDTVYDYIVAVLNKVYQLPTNYLWIIAKYFISTLRKCKKRHPKAEIAIQYVKDNGALEVDAHYEFEQQLVDDVSTILIYRYPHPEMVLAIEAAMNVLSSFYTPVQMSKLFVENVEYKLKRYLDQMTAKLGKPLIDLYRQKQNGQPDTVDQVTLIERYRLLIKLANQYFVSNQGRQQLIEELSYFQSLPQHLTSLLPMYEDNLKNILSYFHRVQPEESGCVQAKHVYQEVMPTCGCCSKQDREDKMDFVLVKPKVTLPTLKTKKEKLLDFMRTQNEIQDEILSEHTRKLVMIAGSIDDIQEKQKLTDEEIQAAADEIEALRVKTTPLDHMVDVKDFEGNVSFTVFDKHAFTKNNDDIDKENN